MIEIAGDYLEGGGAILRVSTALSSITGKPCKVYNIRKGRSQPGLKTQHLESLRTLARICNARLKGDFLGSTEIEFFPEKIESKSIQTIIKTAGSLGLLFQNIKVPASMGEKETIVNVKGGAIAGLGAPPIPYLQNVTLPVLEKFGYKAKVLTRKYGFFPKGGAETEFRILPWKEKTPFILTGQGDIKKIEGISIASAHLEKAKVAERQASSAKITLESTSSETEIEAKYVETDCPGSVIVLWIKTENGAILGADSIGERKLRSEEVGRRAAKKLIEEFNSGAAVDSHLSDQLLIYMALLNESSAFTTSRLTNHAKTNMWVIKKFLNTDFSVSERGKNVLIKCRGSQ